MFTLPKARYWLPNLFTLSSAFCGFAAIWLASQASSSASFHASASLIALAVFLDGFDGRVARWVKGESEMGVQLDSLSDFLTFGVAPAVLAYAWGLHTLGVAGLLIAFLFAAAAMLRLARFNVHAETEVATGPPRFFQGLPAPMAGMSVALLIGVNAGDLGRDGLNATATASFSVLLILLGLLMVSNVPFRTMKDTRPTAANRLMIAGLIALMAVLSVTVSYMVALSAGLVTYYLINVTGGAIAASKAAARARASRDGALVDDDDVDLLG